MLEVLDIVVLDYILGQQDRIGNIDYQWRWLWLEDNALHSATAHSETPPAPGAVRLRTTWLNDNDAGIRSGYANYARSTGMLGDLRHFNPVLYERLGVLDIDIQRLRRPHQTVGPRARHGLGIADSLLW